VPPSQEGKKKKKGGKDERTPSQGPNEGGKVSERKPVGKNGSGYRKAKDYRTHVGENSTDGLAA